VQLKLLPSVLVALQKLQTVLETQVEQQLLVHWFPLMAGAVALLELVEILAAAAVDSCRLDQSELVRKLYRVSRIMWQLTMQEVIRCIIKEQAQILMALTIVMRCIMAAVVQIPKLVLLLVIQFGAVGVVALTLQIPLVDHLKTVAMAALVAQRVLLELNPLAGAVVHQLATPALVVTVKSSSLSSRHKERT
jgi:hypothetical protein